MDEWTEVRHLTRSLRPGTRVRIRLLGGSIAHNEVHEAVLEGVTFVNQTKPDVLFVGPHMVTGLDQVQILELPTTPWPDSYEGDLDGPDPDRPEPRD